jgi:DNA repair protein RecO (recombination protein O)
VTQAHLVDVFLGLRSDLDSMAAAAAGCEAVAGLTPMHEPDERVFALLRNTLKALDQGFEGPAAEAPLLLGFLLKLLAEAGYMPVLEHCASCGGGGLALGFSAAAGGLVCERCLDDAMPVTPEAVAAMQGAVERPLAELRGESPSASVREALRHAHRLYAYHTGARLRALSSAGAVG